MNTRCRSPCYTDGRLDNSQVWCTTPCWNYICICEHSSLIRKFPFNYFRIRILLPTMKQRRTTITSGFIQTGSPMFAWGTGVLQISRKFTLQVINSDIWARATSAQLSPPDSFPIKKEHGAFLGKGADSKGSFKVHQTPKIHGGFVKNKLFQWNYIL